MAGDMLKKTIRSILCSTMLALMVSACASERMIDLAQPPQAVQAPMPDKATVVFMRPSFFGGAIQSSVFDISDGPAKLIGIVSAGKKIAYPTTPGARRFMVVGESADFMDADLAAGKIYYARIEPRFGVWKARFSLSPVLAGSPDFSSDLVSCKWVENTEASRQWAAENMPSISEKRASYLPDWEKGTDRPVLPISAGR